MAFQVLNGILALMYRLSRLFLIGLLVIGAFGIGSGLARADTPAPWAGYSESTGCGQLRVYPPLADEMGWLPSSQRIGGPYGALFGRTIGDVGNALVWWEVPMSGGKRVKVHKRALPAFQQVAANLQAAQNAGHYYQVNYASGYAGRTVGGKLSMSYHAFGAAIDINPPTNPYRGDNRLITDMPDWYVQAWRDAGFCWGGDWVDIKDTMHFSWKGPGSTPGYGAVPIPYRTHTSKAGFSQRVAQLVVPFGDVQADERYLLADTTGNGASDVVQLTQRPDGVMVEIAKAAKDFADCDVDQYFAWEGRFDGRTFLMGDIDADGRNDLWEIYGGPLVVTIHMKASDYEEAKTISTPIVSSPGDRFAVADFDRDGRSDLFVIRTGAATSVEIWSAADGFSTLLASASLPIGDTTGDGWSFSVGDRDVDGVPDIYAFEAGASSLAIRILTHQSGYATVSETIDVPITVRQQDLLEVSDYDGDGRDDLYLLRADGVVDVYLGNTTLGVPDPASWFRDPGWRCPDDAEPYQHDGHFRDDDGSEFEVDIDWLAANGYTQGCNPPYNDRYCPDGIVTRGQMASFIARAFGLPPAGSDWFTDDDTSAHQDGINRVAEAGIALGFPDGTFRPDIPVNRAQMASLLARAMGLAPIEGQRFDDVTEPHLGAINAIAAEEVTVGCNTEGTLYCPFEPVSRGQMAAFLHRALG